MSLPGFGGADGDRTRDLVNAIKVVSQERQGTVRVSMDPGRFTPQPSKSAALRVAMAAPMKRAIAAICASKCEMGRPALRRSEASGHMPEPHSCRSRGSGPRNPPRTSRRPRVRECFDVGPVEEASGRRGSPLARRWSRRDPPPAGGPSTREPSDSAWPHELG